MGYEITYHFYPRKEEGVGYETENKQTFTKQLGKLEDVPVEKLANAIMMQLARRDIWVVDVEIYEFIKRKLSFKETKGGILIKNKKFMLDGTIEVIEEEETPAPQTYEKKPNQAIRWEIFDPEPQIIPMLLKKYRLSPKRRYAILEEKTVIQKINLPSGATEMPTYEYSLIDDQGQKIKVPAMHFVPEQKGLIGMENQVMTEEQYREAPKLMHMNNYGDIQMPVLRR